MPWSGGRPGDHRDRRPEPNGPGAPVAALTSPTQACLPWPHPLRSVRPGRLRVERHLPIPGLHPEGHHRSARSDHLRRAVRLRADRCLELTGGRRDLVGRTGQSAASGASLCPAGHFGVGHRTCPLARSERPPGVLAEIRKATRVTECFHHPSARLAAPCRSPGGRDWWADHDGRAVGHRHDTHPSSCESSSADRGAPSGRQHRWVGSGVPDSPTGPTCAVSAVAP
jgi:hypothetical protein